MTLRAEHVQPALRGSFGRAVYLHAESCPSTQRLLPTDAPHGAVAVAEHQTEGRGRLGRVWVDEPGASLLCSVVLRPTRPLADWPTLTGVAGEAAAGAVAAVAGVRPEIKPPNDLLLGGRKLAGILAEAQADRIVLGLGVNVGAAPHEGSTALGAGVDRAALLAELLLRLEGGFDAWDATRRATTADAPLLVDVFREARRSQGLPFVSAAAAPRFVERVLADEAWVTGEDGFMSLDGDLLAYLYVRPGAQGRGLGSTLLALAKQRRPDGFHLWVFQQLADSRRFYERLGCALVELGDGSGNMEGLPDALYAWTPPTGTTPSG